jgi:hypothetical protein
MEKKDGFMYTIYADETNQVSIICPKCQLEQHIDTTKFKGTHEKLKGKCQCGEPYEFNIEFRNRYRKDVNLPGNYVILGRGGKEDLIITELSLTGLQFETLKPHYIQKDDALEVTFRLDDYRGSEIRKLVKVIWIKDLIIGAHFIETKSYENELRSYL